MLNFDQASFRDPDGHVFFHNGSVYRTLSVDAEKRMKELMSLPFFQDLMNQGCIIPTTLIGAEKIKNISRTNISKFLLQHEFIPFIVYPYEFSFSMLKDAALTQLHILRKCLENGFILKDGTAWNTTIYKGRMCFFDVLSIDRYEEGKPWEGYRQFCEEFLYPLMLQSYKDIDFHAFWLSTLKGIDTQTTSKLFGKLDWLYPGVFKHVFLHSKLATSKTLAGEEVKSKFNALALPKAALLRLTDSLQKIIEKLQPSKKHSVWINYTQKNSYEGHDTDAKRDFIEKAFRNSSVKSVVDLGCNTGEYSSVVSRHCSVISADIDSACIDALYLKIKGENITNITPIVQNLMHPSPKVGWLLEERLDILSRLNVDGFLALALIHHLCIASNVPLESFVLFLSKIAKRGVVEWVDKQDPMVQFLLRNRKDIFPHYNWETFLTHLKTHFKVDSIQEINNGTRKLCLLSPL